MDDVLRHIDEMSDEQVGQLKEYLRIPSVSSDPQRAGDARRACEWMRRHLEGMGLEASIHETPGHPLVFAQKCDAPGAPTVLFYGHGDVQPVEPLDEWNTPPFEPQVVDGDIVARGTSDDKGQLFTHVSAVDAWLKTRGSLPVNVKFLIESEEEVGSTNLPAWLSANPEMLAADVVVISDTAQFAPNMPSICTALRGIVAFEIHVRTGTTDLHSGTFGGAVPNSVCVLADIVSTLHDADGRVAVAGFYDDVAEPSPLEMEAWGRLPHADEEFLKAAGAHALYGEPGRSTLERVWSRPTVEVVGIMGGHQGAGHKGIVPAHAVAKCSARLVARQDPRRVAELIRKHIASVAPPYAQIDVTTGHGTPAAMVPVDSKWVAAAAVALEKGFGAKPVYIREGGSISIVVRFVEDLGMPCLLLGFGLHDDHIHGPNEKFSLADLRSGTKTIAALMGLLGS